MCIRDRYGTETIASSVAVLAVEMGGRSCEHRSAETPTYLSLIHI